MDSRDIRLAGLSDLFDYVKDAAGNAARAGASTAMDSASGKVSNWIDDLFGAPKASGGGGSGAGGSGLPSWVMPAGFVVGTLLLLKVMRPDGKRR